MQIEYVKNDTAPAISVELENTNIDGYTIKFKTQLTAGPVSLTLQITDAAAGKASAFPETTPGSNVAIFTEAGKFPAEVEVTDDVGHVFTFTGIKLKVHDEVA
jgi:hypothetical protein